MMKINNIMVLLMLVFSVFSCQQAEKVSDGTVKISGKLENSPSGVVVLSRFVDDRSEVIDTISVDNSGEFDYTLTNEGANFYDLNLMGKKSVRLALDDEDVEIYYDFENDQSLVLEGSEDSKNMLKIEALLEDYQARINELNTSYYDAMTNKNQSAVRDIQNRAMELEISHGNNVKEVIKEMDGSFAALAAMGMLNPKNDFQFMDSLAVSLNENYPNNKMISNLMQQLDDMRILSIGQPAPDISLPNPDGTIVNLSDLRGKYVLIDFWAAWCKPCREENPNVVRLYNEYKDEGFEVFGVSLDRTKEAWVKAIEDDNLTWTHVSDLKYFNSEAAALYQINAIPATYMIDPEGKIIAKDLRGPSLENKLKELFE